MAEPIDEPELSVDAVMRTWPATVRVFLRHRMRCVGCPVARFHTIREACALHEADEVGFRAALRNAAPGAPRRRPPLG